MWNEWQDNGPNMDYIYENGMLQPNNGGMIRENGNCKFKVEILENNMTTWWEWCVPHCIHHQWWPSFLDPIPNWVSGNH